MIRTVGIPSLVLMERAALAVARRIRKRVRKSRGRDFASAGASSPKAMVLAVCGSGNNGGDGIAAARILTLWGIGCDLFLAGSEEKMTRETKAQLDAARKLGIHEVTDPDFSGYDVIADAVFGVGLSRPVEGRYYQLIDEINQSGAWKVAVDVPSGLNADNGQVMGIVVRADETVTFAFVKIGLLLYPGKALSGRITEADIGICEIPGQKGDCFAPCPQDLEWLKDREPGGNKGTFGKVLIAAGSQGMCGAAYLCASGAFGTGVGMVKIQTVPENLVPLQTLIPEAMLDISQDPSDWEEDLRWCDSLVIGPGLGTGQESRRRAQWFIKNGAGSGKPMLIDADGLNLLAANPEWMDLIKGKAVLLTPHLGEMSRLTHVKAGELAGSRVEYARQYAESFGCGIVMKDASTVTAFPDGKAFVNSSGNCGMACAGSGDALSGILGGIMARSRDLMILQNQVQASFSDEDEWERRLASGVYLHGICGDAAKAEFGGNGMTAGDLLGSLHRGDWLTI